jgi:hypothetical protein
MRQAVAVTLTLGALAFAVDAAATPTSRLTYVRGPGAQGCPDEAELRRAVEERLGYDPFFPWATRTVVAQIEHKPGGFAAELKILDASGVSLGERALPTVSNDCTEIVRSLALAISIAIDDLDTAAPPQGEPPPAPPPSPPPASAPEVDAPAPPPQPPDRGNESPPMARTLDLALELAALGTLASAPAPAAGGAAGARLKGPWWSLGLEGRYDLPASEAIAGGGRVETSLALGMATACVWSGTAWRPFGCLVGTLGWFHGSTTGVTAPNSAGALYAALGARLGTELGLNGPFYAFGHLDGLVSFTPHRALLNDQVVFTLPTLSGEVAVGLGVRIL